MIRDPELSSWTSSSFWGSSLPSVIIIISAIIPSFSPALPARYDHGCTIDLSTFSDPFAYFPYFHLFLLRFFSRLFSLILRFSPLGGRSPSSQSLNPSRIRTLAEKREIFHPEIHFQQNVFLLDFLCFVLFLQHQIRIGMEERFSLYDLFPFSAVVSDPTSLFLLSSFFFLPFFLPRLSFILSFIRIVMISSDSRREEINNRSQDRFLHAFSYQWLKSYRGCFVMKFVTSLYKESGSHRDKNSSGCGVIIIHQILSLPPSVLMRIDCRRSLGSRETHSRADTKSIKNIMSQILLLHITSRLTPHILLHPAAVVALPFD